MINPTNEKVRDAIVSLGYDLNSMKGVKGTFYTTDRLRDLKAAVAEILILRHLSDDLRKTAWRGDQLRNLKPLAGYCYVVAEAGREILGHDWKPSQVRVDGVSHWFLKHESTGAIFDPTQGQFDRPVPYDKARNCGFLTKTPCKRTMVLLERIRKTRCVSK